MKLESGVKGSGSKELVDFSKGSQIMSNLKLF